MDSQWMTARQAAEKWDVSLRYAQRLLADGRVSNAKKYGRSWMIPSGTKKPDNPRKASPPKTFAILTCFLLADERYSLGQGVDSIIHSLETDALRNQCLGEIAYLRGDFDQAKRLAAMTQSDEAAYPCSCTLSLIVAMSTNDFELYGKVETLLKQWLESCNDPIVVQMAETILATAAVSMYAPEMAPAWLKEGDLSHLPEETVPFALYLRIKYLHNIADYPQMLAVIKTMLALYKGKDTVMNMQLLLQCATACFALGEREKARDYLQKALALGMPHGLITPFVENVISLGGLVEECVERHYPYAYGALLAQWQETWKNWAVFHNRFARDNVPLILTMRECRIATLAAIRTPYAQIAQQECLSVGRVRNIIQEIYGKLLVRSREELAALILWIPTKT